MKAPAAEATLLLPLGATFPLIVDLKALKRGQAPEVDDADLVRFRLAPLLPFPISQAEVRTEVSSSLGSGAVLAQAILTATIEESEKVMAALGFPHPRVTSALSAALRGLPPRGHDVDLIFGDSACALALRNLGGVIEAIHLRLLVEGDDRAGRSIDEALRSAANLRSIRVLGEDAAALRGRAGEVGVHPAFDLPTRGRGMARVVGVLGLGVFAYAAVAAAVEWRSAYSERRSLHQARDEVTRVLGPFEQTLQTIRKSPDILVALASVESSPSRVWDDLSAALPEGVSIVSLKVDYTPEGSARLDFAVIARSPAAYDRFLGALSASPLFASLKPGSEIRPGLVRATLSAVHRPRGAR